LGTKKNKWKPFNSYEVYRQVKIAVVVPLHKEIDKGTLLEIMRQSRLKREDFLRLL